MILGKCFLITTHLPGKFLEREAQFLPCFLQMSKSRPGGVFFYSPSPGGHPPLICYPISSVCLKHIWASSI